METAASVCHRPASSHAAEGDAHGISLWSCCWPPTPR